jgi:hypothetical protein
MAPVIFMVSIPLIFIDGGIFTDFPFRVLSQDWVDGL